MKKRRARQPKLTSSGTLRNSFERRTVLLAGLQGSVATLLAVRMGWIGLAENEKYKTLSESNRVNLTLIPPRRGWVLDRHGAPLASNRADFRVDMIPERVGDVDATIQKLAGLLSLTPVQQQDLKDKIDKAHGFAPVEVKAKLSEEEYAAVSVRLPELKGVVAQRGFSRFYPTGPAVGHLVGVISSVMSVLDASRSK